MLSFHGERLPGAGGRPGHSVQARRCGTVAAGTACLRVRGNGAAAAPATGGLPPIGRGQAAAPESPSSPATLPQLQAANLTPPHELPQRIAILHEIGQGRNGPARPQGVPLMTVKKVLTPHTGARLIYELSGQSNRAQMLRAALSPSMPQSAASARMMSSPWYRVGSFVAGVQGPPLSSTSIQAQ